MNRRSSGSLLLSKAISGFLQYKAAEGLSPNTLQSCERDLKLWHIYAGDILVENISTKLIQTYLVWLRTDYKPRRITGNKQALARRRSTTSTSVCARSSRGLVASSISPTPSKPSRPQSSNKRPSSRSRKRKRYK